MAHRVTQQTLRVTPQIASEWLKNNTYPHQRALRPHHVTFLVNAMRQGLFREGTEVCFAVLQGGSIIINGQHTLTAIVQSGLAQTLTVKNYLVKSLEDIAPLYSSFDVHLRRSPSDIYAAYDFSNIYGVSHQNTGALAAALPIVIGGFLPATRAKGHPVNVYMASHSNRIAVMEAWVDHARPYFDLFTNKTPLLHAAQARRASVLAVGILTFRYQPAKAASFWERIAKREYLTAAMPEYRLVNFLCSTTGMEQRPGFAYARVVAAAWNATFRGRTMLKALTPRHQTLPFLLAGTPFNGDDHMMYFHDGKVQSEPVPLPRPTAEESAC